MKRMATMGMALVCAGWIGSVAWAQASKAPAPGMTARLASDAATPGYDAMPFGAGTIHVSKTVEFSPADLPEGREVEGRTLEIMMGPAGFEKLERLVREKGGQRLAIFRGDELVAAPVLEKRLISGNRLVAPLAPRGPVINVVAVNPRVQAGELVSFDVFLGSASDLRGYQVALDAVGGSAGRLDLVDIHIDTARADFVFGSEQAVQAGDLQQGRMVGAMFSGGVNRTTPSYLGTFTYRATPDAVGAFQVKVRTNDDTALRNGASSPIQYQAGTPGVVEIGGASPVPGVKK